MARADGFLIRVLRWILREVPLNRGPGEQQYDIVAVLAGTNSALANFYPEKVTVSESSRYLQKQKGNYYEEGSVPLPPFSCFRTTGCLSADPSFLEGDNEYERTIAYGRPLFAAMNNLNLTCYIFTASLQLESKWAQCLPYPFQNWSQRAMLT